MSTARGHRVNRDAGEPVRAARSMPTHQKILIGSLGALTPVLLNLLAVDLDGALSDLTLFAALGYGARAVILLFLGGIMAFLHKDEGSPVKLFELGVAAPALITGLLNGVNH